MTESNSLNKYSAGKIERKNLCMHVTAVRPIGTFLIVAEGNQVSVFNLSFEEIVAIETVFTSSSIHGIRTENHSRVLFFGSKSLRVYTFDPSASICLKSITGEIILFDWIFDAQWILSHSVAIVTAHNSVSILDIADKESLKTVHCVERCILYAATVISTVENALVVAVGTVFSQVLLWSPNSSSNESVQSKVPFQYLEGHKGVIFSVSYNKYHGLLSSTSDDRSIRLWKITSAINDDSSLEFWEKCSIYPSHILYAHESRVWRSVILENCVISVGEDSSICFWSLDGRLLRKKKAHKGGSIWCLETSNSYGTCENSSKSNCIAITGGSDGGVYCWDIQSALSDSVVSQISLHMRSSSEKDFPRVLSIICNDGAKILMTTTDKGWLSFHHIDENRWEDFYHDSSFASYCVSAVSNNSLYIALGNLKGNLVLLHSKGFPEDGVNAEGTNIHDGKIFSLHWVDGNSEHLLSCGAEGHMVLWKIKFLDANFHIKELHKFHLPKCKPHWWSTAALYLSSSKSLIVGDRGGTINFYCQYEENEIAQPRVVHKSIHGENGVTDIQEHNSLIYSAGRDGRVLLFSIKQKSLNLLHTIKISHDLEWIGKMLFYERDLLLMGFHTKYFIVWSTTLESTVMSVECGGGHRSWDFHITEKGEATFAAIKKKDIIFTTADLYFTLNRSVLKAGISGKEFCATCYLFTTDSESMAVLAAGGEDNALQIIGHTNNTSKSSQIISLHSLSGHLSSIRSIAKTRMTENNTYLVASVGGRAQIMLWKIKNNFNIDCEQLASYILSSTDIKTSKPTKGNQALQFDPQTRLMDVNVTYSDMQDHDGENYIVAVACSDSYFRVYNFDAAKKVLSLCYNIQLGEHCILKLSKIQKTEKLIQYAFFATATTGGYLSIVHHQDLKSLNKNVGLNSSPQEQNKSPQFKLSLHQSGINAIDVKLISGDRWLFCTGGDDCSLFVFVLEIHSMSSQEDRFKILAKEQICSAHTSQITGVRILDNIIASTSVDQRIHLWRWKFDSDSLCVTFDCSKMSVIPDIANLECWRNGDNSWNAVVCGEGIEILSITN